MADPGTTTTTTKSIWRDILAPELWEALKNGENDSYAQGRVMSCLRCSSTKARNLFNGAGTPDVQEYWDLCLEAGVDPDDQFRRAMGK